MFGVGPTEFFVIIVVALVVLGPKNLPKAARTMGKVMSEFRKVSSEFQRTVNAEIALDERETQKKQKEIKEDATQPASPTQQTATDNSKDVAA